MELLQKLLNVLLVSQKDFPGDKKIIIDHGVFDIQELINELYEATNQQNETELVLDEIDLEIKKHLDCVKELENQKEAFESYLESARNRKASECKKFARLAGGNQ